MTIDTIKERDYAVTMPEYDYAFWNAVKRKPHNAKELQKGSVEAVNALNKLIQQHNGCIEHRRRQAKEDTLQVFPFAPFHAGDQHQSYRGNHKAENLLQRHFLFEQNRTHDRHDHRGKVVAEGGNGHGGVLVGLEEKYPVKTHGDAAEEQQGQLTAGTAEAYGLAGDEEIETDEQGCHHGAAESQLGGGEGNVADEEGDGAENHHG